MIRKLPQQTSEFIKSQQYIQNTYTIVKELVENSLDAKSSHIKINIDDEKIKVDDNGLGIEDLTAIGEEGVTSKELTTYYVLGLNDNPSNLFCGYRGLALCSIKNMCSLEILSKHNSNSVGYKKNLSTGDITPFPRERGTSVNVTDIFSNCPIRKKLHKKNLPKDIKNVKELLSAYSKIYDVSFIVKYKGNIIYNVKGYNNIEEYCKEKFKDTYKNSLKVKNEDYFLFLMPFSVDNEMSTIYCGKRVATSKKITKEIKKAFNVFEKGNPTFFLQLNSSCDFNISPSKTEILLENETEILNRLKNDIRDFFSNQKMFIVKNSKNEYSKYILTQNDNFIEQNDTIDKPIEKICDNYEILIKDPPTLDTQAILDEFVAEDIQRQHRIEETDSQDFVFIPKKIEEPSFELETPKSSHFLHSVVSSPVKKIKLQKNDEDEDFIIQDTHIVEIDSSTESVDNIQPSSIKLEESIFDFVRPCLPLKINFILQKRDFFDMEIVGQFNKGFIITKLVKDNINYLIVVDQHAADEIYNYENLKTTTNIVKQKLICPILLQVSTVDSLFIKNNIQIFSKFGFEIEDDKLITLPRLKEQEFTIRDFYDLLEGIKNDNYELSKIHKILASKACRMSIMIGDTLNKTSMEKIVRNLGLLNRPWSCPHGRPTCMIVDKN